MSAEPTNTAHAQRNAQLLDECRELEARLYGKRIELCMHAGQRKEADYWRQAMEKVIRERRDAAHQAAEAQGMDYFTAAASADAHVLCKGGPR